MQIPRLNLVLFSDFACCNLIFFACAGKKIGQRTNSAPVCAVWDRNEWINSAHSILICSNLTSSLVVPNMCHLFLNKHSKGMHDIFVLILMWDCQILLIDMIINYKDGYANYDMFSY
jgi:hypothetical protein